MITARSAVAALALLTAATPVWAQAERTSISKTSPEFRLADRSQVASLVVEPDEAEVVRIAANLLAGDVAAVTGAKPSLSDKRPVAGRVVLVGTLDGSPMIKALADKGLIDPKGVAGVWEAYRLFRVANPWPGVPEALVVLGADRRGAAYGALSISRQLGVSPWQWWADVAPAKRETATITLDTEPVAPAVRYRGVFINDEDWSLRPWAEETFEPETGNIGPKTYAKVFELMLRLRSNLLWPAMHPGSVAFNQDPRNAETAERYGIVMGASHAEPMLRNNVAEWDRARWGEFNFETNAAAVTRYWDERVKANGRFENLYTVGMRGIHDTPVVAGSKVDRVKLLEDIVDTQRGLLKQDTGKDPTTIPQVFVPYKEVLETYRKGMRLPDDVTLGWVDDNFGYIRQLSTPAEQARPGGGGVYYHVSYWGWPTSYLWLATTPPALIASEMGRAWNTNSKTMWIVNIGDIKPSEIDAEYFLDLAWDYGNISQLDQKTYLTRWAARTFDKRQADAIGGVLDDYYRLAFIRKPEHMNFSFDDVGVQPTDFSPVSYGDEASRHLSEYADLLARAEAIAKTLPATQRDAYFELVLYPVLGAHWTAVKALSADRSYLAAWQGRASANLYADRSSAAQARIKDATARYDGLANGKWRRFMNDDPRDQASFAGYPTARVEPTQRASLGVAIEGAVDALVDTPARARADYSRQVEIWRTAGVKKDVLPAIDQATRPSRFIDLFNTGGRSLTYRISADAPWVVIDRPSGEVASDQRVWISVDWSKVPEKATNARLTIVAGADRYFVTLPLEHTAAPAAKGVIVAVDGVVAIEAENFVSKGDVGASAWRVRPRLGRLGAAIEADAAVGSSKDVRGAPSVDYQFIAMGGGQATLKVIGPPTFPLDRDRKLRYAVSIDGAEPQVVDIDAEKDWQVHVVRNARITETRWTLKSGARHTIRLWALDPALVVDRLVVDLGGERKAYLGPPETRAR